MAISPGRTGSSTGRCPTRSYTDFTTSRRARSPATCWGVACTRRWSTGRRPTRTPSDIVREFALIWQALPKVVFSRTLDSVEGANTTLARDDLRAELTSLQESVRGDVAVGGAELAAEAVRLGLIDEYRLVVHPVAVGGGIPFFPRDHRVDLELVETRTFSSRVVYLRYRAAGR